MTLNTERSTYWSPSLSIDLSKGWPQEPPEGTKLGRLQVIATVPAGSTFDYRTLSFRGSLNYFKNIFHNAPPTYDFEVSQGIYAHDIPESEVPTEVLDAFEQGA